MGRKDMSVAQSRYMRDVQYEVTSHIQKMSTTMFVHKVVEAYLSLQRKEKCLMEQKGSMYERKKKKHRTV